MSKKVNKSGRIREYLAEHPTATPLEVAKALKPEGISVSSQFVSTVKSSVRKALPLPPQLPPPMPNVSFSREELTVAKMLLAKAGSKAQAVAALATVDELTK